MTKYMKPTLMIISAMLLLGNVTTSAQEVLSLDSCRARAIRNNKDLQMSALKQEAAHWQRKSALSNYYPRVNAVGSYQFTSKEISLLSDEQKNKLSNFGTTTAGNIQQDIVGKLMQNPTIAKLMQDPTFQSVAMPIVQDAATALNGMLTSMGAVLDATGQEIVNAFNTDTRHLAGGTIMLTQPLYMGGKIRAYDKITRLAEEAAGEQHTIAEQDLLVSVDEAYWRIIALQSKKQLAESFRNTVQKLDNDVEKIIAEGMATKADGLSVKVKLNEAEVSVIQVENGLALSRMALAQLCGLPLDSDFRLADETPATEIFESKGDIDMGTLVSNSDEDNAVEMAMQNRAELHALDIAAQVKDQQVKVARSEYMPNLALTGGYLATYPSLFNGFQKKFDGMWNVGVVLKVPIVTWGDRLYKVRQAKAEAAIAHLRADEVREKITLQVNQNRQKLQEAQHRLTTAERSQAQADENLRMANLGMKEGVIPVSNVLQAQTAWLMAHSALVDAQIDVRLADLYLRRAKGILQ